VNHRLAILIITLVSLALIGCGAKSVVGTWKFDPASIKGASITPEIKQAAQQMFASATIEFKSDGTYVAKGIGPDDTGKWTQSGKTLTTTSSKPSEDKGKPAMTVSDDGTKIHLVFTSPSVEMDMIKAS
jgi:hypothetical protein